MGLEQRLGEINDKCFIFIPLRLDTRVCCAQITSILCRLKVFTDRKDKCHRVKVSLDSFHLRNSVPLRCEVCVSLKFELSEFPCGFTSVVAFDSMLML